MNSGPATYDRIGVDYSAQRRADPRIAAQIHAALGAASTVLNVGAGTGNYEPVDRQVTALEPSAEMIRQRPAHSAPVVQGHAENLPFGDSSFDASMAVLTVHHWTDKLKGLREMRRVTTGPIVIFTFDPDKHEGWLSDYLPELAKIDAEIMPPLSAYGEALGPVDISPVPIPADCSDGFLASYWRRPEAYLDPRIRSGISSFWKIANLDAAMARLASDLDSGAWQRKYGHLLDLDEIDAGYRLVTTI
ncbi:MAG: class I SAM-dependent methyltransferase [Novosphingobium sp.]|nr:class I SAM-dependent methyltransferase [Novosphingobium sp.]